MFPNIKTWKWIVEFLIQIENRCIKIAQVNSILINKSIDLLVTLILYGVDIFKLTASAQFINREVYDW